MKRLLQILLPVVVLGAGVFGMKRLIQNRPEAPKKPPEAVGALVETTTLHPGRQVVTVRAHGAVRPAREVTLMPQVAGRILEVNAALVPGGQVKAGEALVRVEARDYEAQVSQAKAQVERARLDIEMEQGRKSVADREWKLLGDKAGAGDKARDRALRVPQLRAAEATLEAAKASLEMARLNVRRTEISAPFNAVVQSEAVEVGQVVGPQMMMARLVGTDTFWVEAAVPVAELRWLDIPGAQARVTQDTGDGVIEKSGTVARLLGDLDPMGRMARLLVEVPAPLEGPTPLLVGAYVDVEIEGHPVEGVFEVPRVALREGDTLWLVGPEERLVIASAKVLRRMQDAVLVTEGLKDGDTLVTSRLPSPVPGMKLRTQAQPEAQAQALPTAEGGR